MVERPRKDVSDGVSWCCPVCKRRKSIREGSFFAKSRLPLEKWMFLLFYWAREYPVTMAAYDTEITEKSAVDIYQFLRDVCSTKLLQTPIVLGGQGVIVEIDESLFRHKPKVSPVMRSH